MIPFCGIFLELGVDRRRGAEIVSTMLTAFGRDTCTVSEFQPVPNLCLGFAVPVAFDDGAGGRHRIIDRDGFVCFGDVTLWDRQRFGQASADDGDIGLLHRYLRSGGDPASISGDFAIGTVDLGARRLDLLRDQVGVRTILWSARPEGLAFASNARFLVGAGMPPAEPDPLALASYMVLRHPGAGRFFLRGIRELPPAHCLSAVPGEPASVRRYWSIETTRDHGFRRAEECIEHVRERFVTAVRARIADARRPAVALSGGLDSSSVAGVVAALDETREIPAYIHRPGPGAPSDPDDDGPYAESVARRWPNLRLRTVASHDAELLQGAEEWDRRGRIPSPAPFFAGGEALEKAALADGADVLLEGLFGDDSISSAGGRVLIEAIIAGKLGLAVREFRRLNSIPGHGVVAILRNNIYGLIVPPGFRRFRKAMRGGHWMDEFPLRRRWRDDPEFLDHLRENEFESFTWRSRRVRDATAFWMGPRMASSLVYKDRVEGANGLRLRFPMVDVDLLAAVYWTPVEHFVSASHDRNLIREIAAPYLPDHVRTRPGKAPFMPDFGPRMRARLPAFMEEIRRFASDPIFREVIDEEAVLAFCRDALAESSDSTTARPNFKRAIRFFFHPYFIGRYLELRR